MIVLNHARVRLLYISSSLTRGLNNDQIYLSIQTCSLGAGYTLGSKTEENSKIDRVTLLVESKFCTQFFFNTEIHVQGGKKWCGITVTSLSRQNLSTLLLIWETNLWAWVQYGVWKDGPLISQIDGWSRLQVLSLITWQCDVDDSFYSITFLSKTPSFEWYVVRCRFKNVFQKDTCLKEIEYMLKIYQQLWV